MKKRLIPSLLVPELFFPVKREKNMTANVIETIVEQEDFYKSVELGDGFDLEERQRIYKVTNEHGITVTQWLTFLIEENGLDVSSMDKTLRLQTVEKIKESLPLAAEIGAENIALVTGHAPSNDKWDEAVEGLFESLCDIAEACKQYNMNLLIEPLDRFAHKKRVIGSTDETVALLSRVKEYYDNIGIAFDTAHAALNSEDLFEALEKGRSLIHQIHFSNAILDADSELYGDYHMEIGEPGFLTIHKIALMLKKSVGLGIQAEDGLRVACEVRGTVDKEHCFQNELQLRAILKEALAMAVT